MMSEKRVSARQLTAWRKLGRKRTRQQTGQFLAEGERCVEQILTNGRIAVEMILLADDARWEPPAGVQSVRMSGRELETIADTENTQGVVAVCRTPEMASMEDFLSGTGVVVATDAIQDPGNLGTMVRSAVWFGAAGLLCGKGTVDLYHPKVVRSTAGATGCLAVRFGELDPVLEQMERAGWQVFLLDAGPGAVSIRSVEVPDRVVLVVGNEGGGMDPDLKKKGRRRVMIEANGDLLESLNAAVALSVALYAVTG